MDNRQPPGGYALGRSVSDQGATISISRFPETITGPRHWIGDDELRTLQQFYAQRLMQLATRANDDDHRALAYQVAHQALRADPQNKSARAVVNAGEVQRFRQKRTSRGWEIETEHFEITTTHTPEAAEKVGRRLEELHAIWRQVFADYWFTKAELDRRFAGGPSRLVEPNHKVMLFANKQQYVDYLKRDEPGIEVSLGYYAERPRTAYFYADEATLATQFHEATHQLFHERQRRGRAGGSMTTSGWSKASQHTWSRYKKAMAIS